MHFCWFPPESQVIAASERRRVNAVRQSIWKARQKAAVALVRFFELTPELLLEWADNAFVRKAISELMPHGE